MRVLRTCSVIIFTSMLASARLQCNANTNSKKDIIHAEEAKRLDLIEKFKSREDQMTKQVDLALSRLKEAEQDR